MKTYRDLFDKATQIIWKMNDRLNMLEAENEHFRMVLEQNGIQALAEDDQSLLSKDFV